MASTTGQLLRSLALIMHELMMMEEALRDADHVTDSDRRQLRRDVHELRARADHLMAWLANARLEEPKN